MRACAFLLCALVWAGAGCVTVTEDEREAYARLTETKLEEIDGKLRRWSDARNTENFVLEQVLYRDLRREAGRLSEALKLGLASQDAFKRRVSAATLGFSNDLGAAGLLVESLQDPKPGVRAGAMLGLCLLNTRRIPTGPIEGALEDADAIVRRLAVLCLGNLYDPTTKPDLFFRFVESLDDPDAGVRINAALVLGESGEVRAAPVLARAGLSDRNALVRRNAALGLGRLKVSAAVPALVRALKDEMNEVVRVEIVDALEKITDQSLGSEADAWERALEGGALAAGRFEGPEGTRAFPESEGGGGTGE